MSSPPTADAVQSYLDRVRERLGRAGFQLLPNPDGAEVRAHDYGFQATRFGMVDAFVTVARAAAPVTPESVREFSTRWFQADVEQKKGPPRGLFGQVVSHAVLVVDGADEATRDFVRTYAPKHWSSLEFPAVFDLGAGELTWATSAGDFLADR